MPIAQEMKSLTDKIVGDYDARISCLGNIISDTGEILKSARGTVKDFAADRKKMGTQLKKDLGAYAGDLSSSTGRLLRDFGKAHKEMASAQAENLEKFSSDLSRNVKKMLKDFASSHADMSEEMKKDLGTFVKGVTGETKRILGGAQKLVAEYRDDLSGAANAWQKMAGQMTRARHGVAIRIEKGKPIGAGVEVSTAEEAKPKKKGKRGRPRKR